MEVPVFIRLMQPIMQFVGNLGYVGVAILRGLLATAEPSGLVKVVVNIQYVRNFTQPIQQIAQETCCSRWLQPPSAYLNFWTKRKKN